jgi:hypothetical protein
VAAPTRVTSAAPSTGNFNSTTSPKTTTSFDVVAGDLIVVTASVENGGSQSVVTPSASGGSVTWTQRARQPAANNGNTSAAWCWTGVVGATATGITVSLARPTTDATLWWGMRATLWRAHGGVGSVFSATNGTGANSAPAIAASCAANSAVQININDWNAADGTSRTWRTINGAVQTETDYFRDASRHAVYTGYTADTGAAGTITQGLTAPTGQRWVGAGVEILGSTSSTQHAATGVVAATTADAGSPVARLVATGAAAVLTAASGSPAALHPATGTTPTTTSTMGSPVALYAATGTVVVSTGTTGAATARHPAAGATPVVTAASGAADVIPGSGSHAATGTIAVVTGATGSAVQRHAVVGTVTASTSVVGAPATRHAAIGSCAVVSATAGGPSARYVADGTVIVVTTASGTANVFDPSIPPLPLDDVSLSVDTGTRGLALTGEARSLEVST